MLDFGASLFSVLSYTSSYLSGSLYMETMGGKNHTFSLKIENI